MSVRRTLVAIAGGWALLAGGALWIAGTDASAERPPPRVRYDLDAALDATAHVVTGKGTIAWRSDAQVPVSTMRFHLYLNAFRDRRTTFLKDAHGRHRSSTFDEDHPGSIDVTSLRWKDGPDLTKATTFVACDDRNLDDKTVLEVALGRSVAPGEEVVLEVEWTSKLPRVFARTGFAGDFHMVAQWFPKLGVFEDVGEGGAEEAGWNCHQFHRNSEFFADYGVYDVRLRLPASYRGRVGATGERQGETDNGDGTITATFHAEDVHDFAWVCGERFDVHVAQFRGGDGGHPEEAKRVARAMRRNLSEIALPPVRVTFLLMPEHADQRARHERAVFHALALMGLWYGPYPYAELTVVDPDARGRGAGGMEYPTLITGGSDYVLAERGIDPEFVLVHEFGHQHFYGLLGTNEFEDAWMDEGMTTYATAKVLMTAYPPMSHVAWVAGRPWYGQAPLAFAGLGATLGPQIPRATDEWIPWGGVGLVRQVSDRLGVDPPDRFALWPRFDEPSPIAFLRDAAPLTHAEPATRTVAEHERWRYADDPDTDSIAGRKAWEYLDSRAYSTQSYRRTASMLRTLEALLQDDRMTQVMRTYAERFRFKHPTPDDFFATAKEVSAATGGPDLSWFFDELVRGSGTVDFGVHDVVAEDASPDGAFDSVVTVRRFGTTRIPVTVRVAFQDGSVRRVRWERDDTVTSLDGAPPPTAEVEPSGRQYRWVRLRFHEPSRAVAAETDPDHALGLELDRSNDGRRREPDPRAAARLAVRALGWLEMNAAYYGGL